MSWNDLELKVIRWAETCNLIPNASPSSQLLKAVAKICELSKAEDKRDQTAIETAVGDVLVSLITYCALRETSAAQCLAKAHDKIKDRNGTLMPDGTFVKEQQNLC